MGKVDLGELTSLVDYLVIPLELVDIEVYTC